MFDCRTIICCRPILENTGKLKAFEYDMHCYIDQLQVLEAGEHTRGLQEHTQPARYSSHLAPGSTTVSFNVGNPSKELGGRSLVIPSGRCVGGGSSINFTMYTRASASVRIHILRAIVVLPSNQDVFWIQDYDDWETVHENPGWGSKHLIPLLQKVWPRVNTICCLIANS